MSLKDQGTHFSTFEGRFKTGTVDPAEPQTGETYYNTDSNIGKIYDSSNWYGRIFSTTTSTSTTTTSTSTSTTTTSTSTSTTTSTSTSTTTSTTTSI